MMMAFRMNLSAGCRLFSFGRRPGSTFLIQQSSQGRRRLFLFFNNHHGRLFGSSSSWSSPPNDKNNSSVPGIKAFGASEKYQSVIRDLFMSYATIRGENNKNYHHNGSTPHLRTKDLRNLLSSIGEHPSDETLQRIMEQVDADGDGTIDLEEFLNGCDHILPNSEAETIDMDELIKNFRTLDSDGNGVLSLDELEGLLSTLGGKLDASSAQDIMKLADTDGDGVIDLSEFIAFVTDPTHCKTSWRLRTGFRVLLVVGGPGSGKGILCSRLQQHGGIRHYSSGEMLRDEVASGSPLGTSLASLLQEGKLVPSTTMIALLKKHIGDFPGEVLALDGFPRTLENYRDFDEICGPPECAFFIDVPDDVMIERILSRGKGGSGRSDDNAETAKTRIETFHALTRPTLEALLESGVPVHHLDGTGTPDDVWDQLLTLNSPVRRLVEAKRPRQST